MTRRGFLGGLAALAIAFAGPLAPAVAVAQDSRAQAVATHLAPEQAARFSKQVERELAAKGARVAMVFRLGRPRAELPEGISYTHGAFWVYRDIATASGETVPGYAVYNLYAGDGQAWPTTQSRLVQDWPFDFTRGSTVDDMAVIIPTPELQQKLLAVIDSPAYGRLHNPVYSLVSNPHERKYQNCNTFMLDVLGSAIWQTDNPARIKADLKAWFKPTPIKASGLTRLFGPMADQRLRNDDHKGQIRTATYESIAAFLTEYGLLQETWSVRFASGRL